MSDEITPIDGQMPPADPVRDENEEVDEPQPRIESPIANLDASETSLFTDPLGVGILYQGSGAGDTSIDDSFPPDGQGGAKSKRRRHNSLDANDPFLSNAAIVTSPLWSSEQLSNLDVNNLGLPSLGPLPSLGTPIHDNITHPPHQPNSPSSLSQFPIVSICFSSGENKIFTNPMKVNALFRSWEFSKYIAPNSFKVVAAGKCCIIEMYGCPAVRINYCLGDFVGDGVFARFQDREEFCECDFTICREPP